MIPLGEMVHLSIRYTPEDERVDHGMLIVKSDDPVTPQVHAEQVGDGVVSSDTGM